MAADYLGVTLLENECVKIFEGKVLSKQNVIDIRQQFEHIHSLVAVIDKWIATKLSIDELKQLIVSHRGQIHEETLKSIAAQWMQEVKTVEERLQFEEQYALFKHFLSKAILYYSNKPYQIVINVFCLIEFHRHSKNQ